MDGERRGHWRTGLMLGLIALVAAADVAGIALFSQSAPHVDFLDLARAAAPGLAFAGAAAAVVLLGARPSAPLALTVASLAASAPVLAIGLQQRSGAWVAIGAIGQLLAPAVVVVALAFPDGRLRTRVVRSAVGAVSVGGLAMSVTTALTYDPAAWGWCQCVANPLSVGTSPATYLQVVDAVAVGRMLVVGIGLLAMLLTFRQRTPVALAFAGAYALVSCAWLAEDAWSLLTIESAPDAVLAIRDAALVLVPVLYAVGYASQRPSRAHVADLLLAARDEHHPGRLRELVARALGDPAATVGWWDSRASGYLDHHGDGVDVPEKDVLRVEALGRPIAVVLSDRLPSVDPGVRESVAEALLLAAENRRLTAELQESLEQVRDSRARILTASDDTRRRIERDLHDGAQQLLISTGIKLNLAAARVGGDDAELAQVLEEATAELNRALSELRTLAGGIAPTALVHGSLANALQELALRSAVPTSVRVTGEGEPDERLAATVYFVVAECLANVAKHADATSAAVEVTLGDPLTASVSDDGHGGASLDRGGTGLRGLVDRVEARGGRLDVTSGPEGTVVAATVPVSVADVVESLEG